MTDFNLQEKKNNFDGRRSTKIPKKKEKKNRRHKKHQDTEND